MRCDLLEQILLVFIDFAGFCREGRWDWLGRGEGLIGVGQRGSCRSGFSRPICADRRLLDLVFVA
jgi:hypothetical protein